MQQMTGNDGRSSKKSIDLDSQDEFWETNKSMDSPVLFESIYLFLDPFFIIWIGSPLWPIFYNPIFDSSGLPFPEVAPEVESKLNEYRAASDKITKLSGWCIVNSVFLF